MHAHKVGVLPHTAWRKVVQGVHKFVYVCSVVPRVRLGYSKKLQVWLFCVNFQPFYVFFQLYPAVCVVPVLKQFVNVVSVFLCCMLEFDDIWSVTAVRGSIPQIATCTRAMREVHTLCWLSFACAFWCVGLHRWSSPLLFSPKCAVMLGETIQYWSGVLCWC